MIPQRKGLASRQAHVDLPEGTVEEEHDAGQLQPRRLATCTGPRRRPPG